MWKTKWKDMERCGRLNGKMWKTKWKEQNGKMWKTKWKDVEDKWERAEDYQSQLQD